VSARYRWSQGVARKPSDPVVECSRCNAPATMSEWSALSTGSTAFYSYCSRCWHEPGPNAPSPAVRTAVNAPGHDSNDRAYMARDHLESIISKP
jgi:hypothetical protein